MGNEKGLYYITRFSFSETATCHFLHQGLELGMRGDFLLTPPSHSLSSSISPLPLSPPPSPSLSSTFLLTSSSVGGSESVGLLGEVSQSQALASLLSCPLLEDLGKWSQWELVFRPLYGCPKAFIDRNAGRNQLLLLHCCLGLCL